MTEAQSARLHDVLESFLDRYRRGERPSLTEFTQQHPDLADELRDLLPPLLALEELGSVDDASSSARLPAAAMPEQLGDFRILREVGRGGMGVVYEAVQESLGRHVALKVLPGPHGGNPSYLERFRREAQAAACLHHTNIVPVFGVGDHDGVPYYAMQFIQGQGLDAVLDELKRLRQGETDANPSATGVASLAHSLCTGQFVAQAEAASAASAVTLEDSSLALMSTAGGVYCRSVARVGQQVAEALAYAHRQGILHRDIKPANLLLDSRGAVWVTDFGLAKREGADDLTGTGDLVGTLRYMAPERFRGQGDPRSDLYGLGMTLYEMLMLRPAFADSDRLQLMERVRHAEPPRPRKIDPRIPRDLETIVLKALAKEPAQRYASAEQMAEDLGRFLADRPIRARRASFVEHGWRWCRRNPLLSGLTSAVVVLLLVLTVGSLIANWQLKIESSRAGKRKAMHGSGCGSRSWSRRGRNGAAGGRASVFAAWPPSARPPRSAPPPSCATKPSPVSLSRTCKCTRAGKAAPMARCSSPSIHLWNDTPAWDTRAASAFAGWPTTRSCSASTRPGPAGFRSARMGSICCFRGMRRGSSSGIWPAGAW